MKQDKIVDLKNLKQFAICDTYGANSSSKGMLYKWTGTLDGKLIYVKTGVRYRGNFSDF